MTAFLSSCETDVEIDVPAHTPKLAVEFNLSSEESSQEMFIGRSQGILSSEDLWRTGMVKDAQITIKDKQGVTRQSFVFVPYDFNPSMGHYTSQSSFTPQPEQEYTLTVAAPGFEAIQSTVIMPQPVPIGTAAFQSERQDDQYLYSGRLRVEFKDPQGPRNYYRLTGYVLDSNGQRLGRISTHKESDVVFGEEVEQIEMNKVFDDGWANKGVVSFANNVYIFTDPNNYNKPAALQVNLEHITQDLYLYERSRANYQEDNPFSEPLNLHSNIRNGYGNFGGITITKYIIQL